MTEDFSKDFLDKYFEKEVAPLFADALNSAGPRIVTLILGQPGSGKTTLANKLRDERRNLPDTLGLNIDIFRALHPRYKILNQGDAYKAAVVTKPFAHQMRRRLIRLIIESGAPVVLENTMVGSVTHNMRLFSQAGYYIHVYFIAVHSRTSTRDIVKRFISEHDKSTGGRWVPLSDHNKSYRTAPRELSRLVSSNLLDMLTVCTRIKNVQSFDLTDGNRDVNAIAITHSVVATRNARWDFKERQNHVDEWNIILADLERLANVPRQTRMVVRQLITEANLLLDATPHPGPLKLNNIEDLILTPHNIFIGPAGKRQAFEKEPWSRPHLSPKT